MAFHGSMLRTPEQLSPGQTKSEAKFGRLLPVDLFHVDEAPLLDLASAMLESVGRTEDNPEIPAAYTYLGQFVDHDVTFDSTAIDEVLIDPSAVTNFRSPRFDLDSVYGGGPAVQPYLYQRDDPDLFEIGCAKVLRLVPKSDLSEPDNSVTADLPRSWNRFALIGDPRNDENFIVAQLHLAFLLFHNKIVEHLREDRRARRGSRKGVFVEARDLAIRHYQWMLLHDFLPRIVGQEMIDSVIRRRSLLAEGGHLFMPVEFSAAAYRFGHSTLRSVYNINNIIQDATLKDLFDFSGRIGSRANVPIPRHWVIEWFRLLHMDSTLKNTLSRRIDPYLADDLAMLPVRRGATDSLPAMNLRRGNMLGLPTGQSVARFFECEALTPSELAQGPDGAVAARHGFDRNTPLWFYVLKEALVRTNGRTLGPVGGRIVAEVFIGLLELDESSILKRAQSWTPTLQREQERNFTLADLLRFAGVLADDGPGPSLLEKTKRKVLDSCFSPVGNS